MNNMDLAHGVANWWADKVKNAGRGQTLADNPLPQQILLERIKQMRPGPGHRIDVFRHELWILLEQHFDKHGQTLDGQWDLDVDYHPAGLLREAGLRSDLDPEDNLNWPWKTHMRIRDGVVEVLDGRDAKGYTVLNLDTREVKPEPVTRLSGVLLVAGVPTATGRVYSKEALQGAIEDYQKKTKSGQRLYGTNSPMNPISLYEISHEVTDLKIEDDARLVATITVLPTPKGEVLKKLVEGPPMREFFEKHARIVPQGIGHTHTDENGVEVVDSFELRGTSFEMKDPAERAEPEKAS